MYPRNAASPPRISIGAVVQISDGAVQTAGVAVKVIPQGGSEASGAGTVAYSADGVVLYTPTQGETDYAAFALVASKAGCIPATVTVVTSASETAGYAGIDWAKIGNPTSTVALSGTTVSTSQVVASVSGAVGSISGVTFPANFAALLINASGHVSRVVLVDTTTTNTDMRGTDNAALASSWTATRAAYLDSVLQAQNSNQRTVQVTGSNHIAADVHEFQPDVLTSAATAASFVAEVQSGLATSAALAVVDGIVDQLKTRSGYTLSILAGAIANAQNAAEAYTITLDGTAYGVTYAGLDSSGNRTGATLTET